MDSTEKDTTVRVIDTPQALADAAVAAFLNGSAAQRQHIVDTLGSRGTSP